MKTVDCFTCDLSLGCSDCPYRLDDGYAYKRKVKRANEAWNYYHPDDLMPQTGFDVHHIDYNRLNDTKENLQKLTVVEHHQLHMKRYWDSLSDEEHEELCKKMSKSAEGNQNGKGNKGKKRTEEVNEKHRQFMLGKQYALDCKHTEEWKKNKSKEMEGNQHGKGNKGRKLPPRTEEHRENHHQGMLKYWKEKRKEKKI